MLARGMQVNCVALANSACMDCFVNIATCLSTLVVQSKGYVERSQLTKIKKNKLERKGRDR